MKTGRFFRQGRNLAALLCLLAIMATFPLHAEVISRITVPYEHVVSDPLLPQPMLVIGEIIITELLTIDQNGVHHYKIQKKPGNIVQCFWMQGGEPVGDPLPYNAVGITQLMLHVDYDPLDVIQVIVNNFYLIGKGDLPNYKVHQTIVLTVDQDGTVRYQVNNTKVTCH